MTLEAGGVTVDLHGRVALVGGKKSELAARKFSLAETFFWHPGQVLTREQLLSHVRGYDDPGPNIVEVYVAYLRKKLPPGLMDTVRGSGYRLASP